MKEPIFLSLAEIIELHSDQIKLYGGSEGVRNMHLLQSALAQPEASFGGVWLHEDLFEMAAAYGYHICQNHPFIDGNKRAGLAAALTFLGMNDIMVLDPKGMLCEAVISLASGKMSKKEFASLLRRLPHE